ncbi:MAG: Gfo/Idh/MocA family oxidoreductase [Bacteroidales bacterium]|nr:Gfo/Idh/MocA family oxidoreductase [Bacteroidales bacterium]
MESRRSFLKKTGKSALLTSMVMASSSAYPFSLIPKRGKRGSDMRIGIIGAENSHTIGFGKMFNTDNKFPGIEVKYVWGETEEFARKAMEKGNIPNMVSNPSDMLGKIDALIVDHRHAKYHLEAATPFVKAGIPTFIDKPFCYRVSEGKEFLAMAREAGTPVTSFSSVRQSDATFDMKKQMESLGEFNHIVSLGPADLESKYGGIFFYGVHIIEPLLFLFGENVSKVRITRNEKNSTASLAYDDGKLATLIFNNMYSGWETFIDTKEGLIKLDSSVEKSDPTKNYVDMVEMFRTGKEPRSHQSILAGVAVLEALEESVITGDWVDVPKI